MSNMSVGASMVAVALLHMAAAAFINYEALTEAYGSGPPYYRRTTNMDKWSDPLPELLAMDAVVVVAAGLLIRAGRRRLRG